MGWLIERGRAIEASCIASDLMIFWAIRGHAAEGLWWYEQTLEELTEGEVRARLGEDRWALAYAAGRSTSIDGLLKDIDGVLRRGTAAH